MAEAKTKKTAEAPAAFIARVEDEATRRDCRALIRLMEKVTGEKAAMWGPSIVGFGSYHYVYASGTTGDWPLIGFSPRKRNLTLYLMPGFEHRGGLLEKLGPHAAAKSCLYLKSLDGIDLAVLERMLRASVAATRKAWPARAGAKKAAAKAAAKPRRKAARRATR